MWFLDEQRGKLFNVDTGVVIGVFYRRVPDDEGFVVEMNKQILAICESREDAVNYLINLAYRIPMQRVSW